MTIPTPIGHRRVPSLFPGWSGIRRLVPALLLALATCTPPQALPTALSPAAAAPQTITPQALSPTGAEQSGPLGNNGAPPAPVASYGPSVQMAVNAPATADDAGDVSLNFAGTDLATVVDQILGNILHQNYTIDNGVQGSVTLRTTTPISRDALIPTLQTLLAQNNAVLVRSNGIYRVMAADAAAATPQLASDDALGGAVMVPLHYAQAAPLTQALEPFISSTAKIMPAADANALIVEGDPASRQALVSLIEAFDVDTLAGQSYEIFPVTGGDAKDFGQAFSAALNKSTDPSQPGPVMVVPLERINAVLVIARSQSLLADAQRVYAVLSQAERDTLRSWHVYFLHNSRANDAAYVLQQAFTPDDVTAQPTPPSTGQINTTLSSQSGNNASGTGSGGGMGSSSAGNSGAGIGAAPAPTSAAATDQSSTGEASALLGPLSASGTGSTTDAIRIIPDPENNSLLIYATAEEDDRISAMLDQVDVAPVEVRIDATIAEVDLTGALQYGTQFFFKSGGINAVLSQGTSAALATNFPGFVLSGHGGNAAPLAISLLQAVTKVNVLSSPELMVLDGQSASLQVGDLVPYLTQSSQSTLSSGAPVVNSIDYRETGVILQVTPHVGSDGLVTLDVSQEVSGVAPSVTTAGISSPTFSDRAVSSRVAIQDGETIGLAGLISDSDSHENQGVPFLKNVPLLGDLFATQNNNRTRTELLVLITPHVIRTESDAAALTADLRAELPDANAVPAALTPMPPSQSADPDARLRAQLPP